MVDHTERRWRPEGRGAELLSAWAYYSRGYSIGGPGSGDLGVLRAPLDKAHDDEMPEGALAVDRILARFGAEYPDHRRAVKSYFLDARATWEIAAHLRLTQGYVRLMIQATCDLVDRQFDEVLQSLAAVQ